MNNTKKPYLFSIILSILIFGVILFMPVLINRMHISVLFGVLFCIYFLMPQLALKLTDSNKTKLIKTLIVIIPALLAYFFFPLINWNLKALPLGLAVILGGLLAYFLHQKHIILKLVLCTVFFLVSWFNYPKFSAAISYRKSFVDIPIKENTFLGMDKVNAIFKEKQDKLMILEFWNSACGQCIKDFPKFQEFYDDNYKTYNIYSVNVPWKRDKINGFDPIHFVDSLGYNFPVISMDYPNAKELGVQAFPIMLVIKNNRVKYNGRFYHSGKGKYNFDNILNKIKNE